MSPEEYFTPASVIITTVEMKDGSWKAICYVGTGTTSWKVTSEAINYETAIKNVISEIEASRRYKHISWHYLDTNNDVNNVNPIAEVHFT